MRWFIFSLLAILAVEVSAEPAPNSGHAVGYQIAGESSDLSNKNFRILNTNLDDSSGRLFLGRFIFKKMFGQKPNPPIIPIIITGGNNEPTTNIDTPTSTAVTTPTSTTVITDPATINTDPTGTAPAITTNTPTDPANPANPENPDNPPAPEDPVNPDDASVPSVPSLPTNPTRRFELFGLNEADNDIIAEDAAINVNQNLANAEEFIVMDQKIKNIYSVRGNRAPALIKLRLRGDKRDQIVTLTLPARYRGYFKNGQRVVLQGNKGTRPGKRRVIRRRRNRRRGNKNKKNKRRRFITI